jgi:hypothetical protein
VEPTGLQRSPYDQGVDSFVDTRTGVVPDMVHCGQVYYGNAASDYWHYTWADFAVVRVEFVWNFESWNLVRYAEPV